MMFLGLAAAAATLSLPSELHARANRELGLSTSDVVSVELVGRPGDALNVMLPWRGQPAMLELRPHSVRADGFQILEDDGTGVLVPHDPGPVRTLRGELLGLQGGQVAAAWLDDGLYARIRTADGGDFWLQPLAGAVAGADPASYVLYETCDVVDHGRSCGSELLAGNAQAVVPTVPAGGPGTYGLEVAELGCDADYQYYLDWGSVAAVGNRIQSVINSMNLQYESEVSISHEITTILVRTTSSNPYTSSDPVTLLNQFRNEWQGNQGSIQRDVAQLFTGKNVDGGTIGIAWLGGVCNSFGYNLVESDFNGNFSCATDLSSHELGHNWNADHCSCTSNTMNPWITCANTFSSSQTRPDIVAYRNSVGCLGGGGGGGPVTLFEDGFESGNFGAGGWVLSNNRPRVKPAAARTGSWGARVRRASSIERAVSTAGFSNVRLEYSRRTRNLDAGETFAIEWFNGTFWNTVEVIGNTNNQWSDVSVDLPASAANNSAFRVRFTVSASEGKERGDVDDVRVIGS